MRWRRLVPAGALVASTMAVAGTASAAEAPTTEAVTFNLSVRGPDPYTTLTGITVEFFNDGGTDVVPTMCVEGLSGQSSYVSAWGTTECATLPIGDYVIGLEGVPDGYEVIIDCYTGGPIEAIEDANAEVSLDGVDQTSCDIEVLTLILAVDKIVDGGTAVVGDFEFEVYADGALVPVPEPIVDPSAALCEDAPEDCLLTALPRDEYVLGELLPAYGYALTDVECTLLETVEELFEGDLIDREVINSPDAEFVLQKGDAYCVVTNSYREGQLVVTLSVTNDDGGTATPSDFSVEVYEAGGGAPILGPTACAADGSCLDVMLPIGDYVVGYTGPGGYTHSVTQSVTPAAEMIVDDPDAAFTLGWDELVEIEIALDDQPPTTTTTEVDAGGGTLPATGAAGGTTTALALAGVLLVLSGSVLVAARRRI